MSLPTDAATALAQIKECMSATSDPVACVMLRSDGGVEEIVTDQRKMGQVLGGGPTFVGAIASLGVQAVALDGAKKKSKHTFSGANFEAGIKGDVLLFRIDDSGAPLPFTPVEYKAWVDAGCPDDVESEDEEDGEDEMEEEEAETLEEFTAKMKDVPVKDLKLVAASMGVSASGSKTELIARLHEAARAAQDEDDDDDDEDDEDSSSEEEEEEEEEAPPPPAKKAKGGKAPSVEVEKPQGKAKASPAPVASKGKGKGSPAPVKTIAKGRKGKN
ncbi:hypothetical protein T484DRAFT_1775227 [Baffinella frigidus]|nr:hypothetical protein T484DRAFT_1775227 [Cryptophyta sp. CCMP2293]